MTIAYRESIICRNRQMVNSHLSFKWTGEDSNLRSPQGAADLQSAAINHSATCAHLAELYTRPGPATSSYQKPLPGTRFCQNFGNAAQRGLFAQSFWEAAAWVSSLGEFCDLPGLLLAAIRVACSTLKIWSWRRDLNPRPSDYKSDALPAELRQRTTLTGTCPNQA